MDASVRQAIEITCRGLLADYAVAVDRGDGAAMAALFAPDGVLRRGDLVLTGRAEIPMIVGQRPADLVMRHLVSTVSVRVIDAQSAEALAYYTVYNARGAALPLPMVMPFSIGEWHSAFVPTPAGWLLSRLEIRRVFVSDAAQPAAAAPGR